MQTHLTRVYDALPRRGLSTALTLLSVVVLVTSEAGAALVATVWGLSGLLHLSVGFQNGLYVACAFATLAVAVWTARHASRAEQDFGEGSGG